MNPIQMRLSPSGPVLGNPPELIGGNSNVAGRVWVAQGVGVATEVPGPAAASVLGLENVPVNLKPGYTYDVEFDTQTFGNVGTSGGLDFFVMASHDNGATYPEVLVQVVDSNNRSGCHRMQKVNVISVNNIDHVRCMLRAPLSNQAGFLYSPTASAVRITEISAAVIL